MHCSRLRYTSSLCCSWKEVKAAVKHSVTQFSYLFEWDSECANSKRFGIPTALFTVNGGYICWSGIYLYIKWDANCVSLYLKLSFWKTGKIILNWFYPDHYILTVFWSFHPHSLAFLGKWGYLWLKAWKHQVQWEELLIVSYRTFAFWII